MNAQIADVQAFWEANPCGSTLSGERDRRQYFAEIERKRYQIAGWIPQVARFASFRGRDVLEIGCGIGTDGLQFARNGARYVGVDLTPTAVELAREQFRLCGVDGRFEVANAEELPFADESFDHVYSWGVIHHSPDTEAIVRQMFRVLRPGGTFCVMVYNRTSINYYVEIMFLRRLFRLLLYPPCMPSLLAKATGFDEWKLQGHREMMVRKRKPTKEEWLSINTDGPRCPLAKVYSREEALRLFAGFADVHTEVWHFDRSHWPLVGKLLPPAVGDWLGRTWGWCRIVSGRKPIRVSPAP